MTGWLLVLVIVTPTQIGPFGSSGACVTAAHQIIEQLAPSTVHWVCVPQSQGQG